ncbi:SH3 domain-containing protein [Chryseobacterium ureilyticum]|uniref:SH3 domain-containing protein n=2 Tax=Chryseobacterium ureilyticum TaxID=373668 RepID=A0A1N7KUE3_9FLAO|nr:SH3 domain-containing protein [Chryseobacterium ureilyticum]
MGKFSVWNKKMDRNLNTDMKRIFFLFRILIVTSAIACNGQDKNSDMKKTAPYNVSQVGDGKKFNYDNFSIEIIEKAKKDLKNFGFKFPAREIFRERILKVYGMDIFKYDNNIIALRPSDFPEIVIKNENYILVQDSDSNNEFFINSEMLYYYNKFVFYNDKNAFNLLKAINPYLLKDLVIVYGYDEDKELIKYVFKDYDFSNEVNTHDLIFSYNPENNKYKIRKAIMDDIENFVYGGRVEDFSYAKEGNGYNSISEIIQKIEDEKNNYINPDETIAYLYDKELQIGILGYIQKKLDNSPDYAKFLKKNDFYKFEKLKQYVEVIYQPSESLEIENVIYTIHDPDGYTNLRKDKSTSSEILQKVKSGEHIEVLDNTGDWFLVKTKEGKEGYIHKSRMKN